MSRLKAVFHEGPKIVLDAALCFRSAFRIWATDRSYSFLAFRLARDDLPAFDRDFDRSISALGTDLDAKERDLRTSLTSFRQEWKGEPLREDRM